jgi:Family of unknown function (DUF5984)
MIRFRFALTPLDKVAPWGEDGSSVHWFGLSDGWYWIEAGGREWLRYAPETVARLALPHAYLEYYVTRFWEDLYQLVPYVMEPIPEDLAEFAVSARASWRPQDEDYEWTEEQQAAAIWHGRHSLNLGYVRSAPRIWFWRAACGDADTMTGAWRHPHADDIGWAAGERADVTIATSEFTAAVREFDAAFLAAMRQRLDEIGRDGMPGGTPVDMQALERQHESGQARRGKALSWQPRTDWAAVRAGAAALLAARA